LAELYRYYVGAGKVTNCPTLQGAPAKRLGRADARTSCQTLRECVPKRDERRRLSYQQLVTKRPLCVSQGQIRQPCYAEIAARGREKPTEFYDALLPANPTASPTSVGQHCASLSPDGQGQRTAPMADLDGRKASPPSKFAHLARRYQAEGRSPPPPAIELYRRLLASPPTVPTNTIWPPSSCHLV